MGRKNNDRDSEKHHSAENHASTTGNGNKTYQAGGDIVEGNKAPDEGRIKTDIFTFFSEVSCSIGRFLFKVGIGDRLERLSFPTAGIAVVFLLTILGNNAHAATDPAGITGALLSVAAYAYSQISAPLLGILGDRLEIAMILALLVGLPIWYTSEKFFSTCNRCGQPFAAMSRTIEYPSRSTVDGEGNRHVPVDRDRFCIYCDGDVEDDDPNHGETAPQVMADGGGDNDAGVCCCSCHNEN